MIFDVITLFPDMIASACNHSILQRALINNLIQVNTINPRDYTKDKHKKVDDTPFGGGAGMLLACQPVFDTFGAINKTDNYQTIMLTPQGVPFSHNLAKNLSEKKQLILLCGHYEGFDERIRTGLDKNLLEVSLGDFVLTGGELGALCIIDAVTRFVNGALGTKESNEYDTFADGLLEYPQYTKPRNFRDMNVPEVLLNGNHKEIQIWRREQQIKRTLEKRPDLFEKFEQIPLTKEDIKILEKMKKKF